MGRGLVGGLGGGYVFYICWEARVGSLWVRCIALDMEYKTKHEWW